MSSLAWLTDNSPIADPFGYGERAVKFIRLLKHPKSRARGKQFQLDLWQERYFRRVYGPCWDDGQRQTRVVYLQAGRGNRKTSMGGAHVLIHTLGPEKIPGGQAISAAADRKQARIAYEEALSIVGETPQLSNVARVMDYKNRLSHKKSGAVYEAISADAATQFGRTPNFALVDELWAHRKADLWQSIRTGLTKVPGSLLVICTTAGRGTETPDYPIYNYAKKVAAGEIDDPSFLPIIFEAPKDCDWQDEAIWHAVNPGLVHGYPDIDGLRQLAREARERPADREAFQQFHLGIRQEHSTSPFVDIDVFDEGRSPIADSEIDNQPCWIAVDCSTTTDLTGVLAAFRDENDGFKIKAWAFVPEENLQARADRDGVPYPSWAKQGWIIPTPGNAIDYRAVEAHVRGLCKRFDVREIVADPAYAQQVIGPLTDDGFPTATMRQGWFTQSPALNLLERAIVTRRLKWDSPVLRWCVENVAIHADSSGNRTMHKGKSRDRIDLAVCLWMAIARASHVEAPSLFASPDFDPSKFLVSL